MNYTALRECLLDLSQPLPRRTHAAFHLRTMGTVEAVDAICTALLQRSDSALMRHELAYILGQMQRYEACPVLEQILADLDDDVLVRHEAAEALGAIGNPTSKDVLFRFKDDPATEVRETVQLALDLISWRDSQKHVPSSSGASGPSSVFVSVDPAPAEDVECSTSELAITLQDQSVSLFKRYRAMFALRNLNTDESALALALALKDPSALVRHEIAYVLGQMQRPITYDALSNCLRDTNEHRMVRHEAAEALGAIGGPDAETLLAQYRDDSEAVVKESCDVALDTMEYWTEFSNGDSQIGTMAT